MDQEKKIKMLKVLALIILLGAASIFIINYLSIRAARNLSCGDRNLSSKDAYLDEDLSIDKRLTDLLSRMTLREKIGQMALVEKNSLKDPMDVAYYNLGAVLSGSGGNPEVNNPETWREMVQSFQGVTENNCLSIPILYGVDITHGHTNLVGATIFPHSIGLGASHNADLVYQVARATQEEMMATGVNWGYSPTLDVVTDDRWGRTYETFGSDTDNVSKLGEAYVRGLQYDDEGNMLVAASAKHYLGLGAMVWGTSINKGYSIDQGETMVSEEELRKTHLPPFQKAVESGVASVMVGLNSYEGKKLSANSYLLNDVLKTELNFKGFVVSDWYGVYKISASKYISLVEAINAGVDMIMLPYDYKTFITFITLAVKTGDISEIRIDEAASRILRVKLQLGLFDKNNNKPNLSVIGSPEHREIARQAVRESLVLLKNTEDTIPLSKEINKIIIAGSTAHNLGIQAGGWTIEWQGVDGNWFPGDTVLDAIKSAVSSETDIEYNVDGNFSNNENLADVAIAVVGEKPYSEGFGDNEFPRLSVEDLQVIYNLRQHSKKLVVIIVSGRPLDIKEYMGDWDAVVAAWLPGSEGKGISDVIFGDYDFKGSLPLDWDLE